MQAVAGLGQIGQAAAAQEDEGKHLHQGSVSVVINNKVFFWLSQTRPQLGAQQSTYQGWHWCGAIALRLHQDRFTETTSAHQSEADRYRHCQILCICKSDKCPMGGPDRCEQGEAVHSKIDEGRNWTGSTDDEDWPPNSGSQIRHKGQAHWLQHSTWSHRQVFHLKNNIDRTKETQITWVRCRRRHVKRYRRLVQSRGTLRMQGIAG